MVLLSSFSSPHLPTELTPTQSQGEISAKRLKELSVLMVETPSPPFLPSSHQIRLWLLFPHKTVPVKDPTTSHCHSQCPFPASAPFNVAGLSFLELFSLHGSQDAQLSFYLDGSSFSASFMIPTPRQTPSCLHPHLSRNDFSGPMTNTIYTLRTPGRLLCVPNSNAQQLSISAWRATPGLGSPNKIQTIGLMIIKLIETL